MSKKGGGAGDGKITPKNPSLRMRPRGGFWGGGGGGGNPGFGGFWEFRVVGVVVAFHKKWPVNWNLSKQTLSRSSETSRQETNKETKKIKFRTTLK